jgi:hypothetical protein
MEVTGLLRPWNDKFSLIFPWPIHVALQYYAPLIYSVIAQIPSPSMLLRNVRINLFTVRYQH